MSQDQPDEEVVLHLLGKPMREVEDHVNHLQTLVPELFAMWRRRCVLRHAGTAPQPSSTPTGCSTANTPGRVHARKV